VPARSVKGAKYATINLLKLCIKARAPSDRSNDYNGHRISNICICHKWHCSRRSSLATSPKY